MRGKISLLIGNKFNITLTRKQPAGGVSGMLAVDTLSCKPIRTRFALEMFHFFSPSARYILSSSVESSKIVVVLPFAATDKVLYANRNKQYTSYHSVIRFQRWSSPALHSTRCSRHPRTCSFVDLLCKPRITSISAIACPTYTPDGPSESTKPLMTYTAGRRQLRCSEYRETV